MRGLLATLMLLLLNLQPLAGAAVCLRHHSAQGGAACDAAMQVDSADGMHDTRLHDGASAGADDMAPMADECAAAMACAAPAPIVTGPLTMLVVSPYLLLSEAWPLAAHRADAPIAPSFRPPIA